MKKLITILVLVMLPFFAQAQEAIYVSGLLGLTTVDTDADIKLSTELSYGLRAGVLFNDNIAVGLYINRYSSSGNIPSFGSSNLEYMNMMAEGVYHFQEADENGLWVSALLGLTDVTQSCPTGAICTTAASETSYGGSVGYHFMLAPNYSLSPQFTMILIDGTIMSTVMGNFSFWF